MSTSTEINFKALTDVLQPIDISYHAGDSSLKLHQRCIRLSAVVSRITSMEGQCLCLTSKLKYAVSTCYPYTSKTVLHLKLKPSSIMKLVKPEYCQLNCSLVADHCRHVSLALFYNLCI